MVVFLRRNLTACQVMLHALEDYATKRLLNGGVLIAFRLFLCALQLLHLESGQLERTTTGFARPNRSNVAAIEFELGQVFDAWRIREAPDRQYIRPFLKLFYLPLPSNETVAVNFHGRNCEHSDLAPLRLKHASDGIPTAKLSTLTRRDGHHRLEECE